MLFYFKKKSKRFEVQVYDYNLIFLNISFFYD